MPRKQGPVASTWLEQDKCFINSQNNLLEMFDLLLNRGFESHHFLRGTGIFYEDILNSEHCISPRQFHQLIQNIEKLNNSEDIAFLWGERQFYATRNPFSEVLANAFNLKTALEQFKTFALLISPLWLPHCYEDDQYYYLYWTDSFGHSENNRFLMAASCGYINSLIQRLCGQKPAWRLFFQHQKPAKAVHYSERFGNDYQFDSLANVICIDRKQLLLANPQSNQTASTISLHSCQYQQQLLDGKHPLIDAIYHYLLQQVTTQPTLDSTAEYFTMSPATLKRKLKQHQRSYQQINDQARAHTALYLLYCKSYSNERIAEQLNFHDARNFRRSFKRWTGSLPSVLRRQTA